MQQDPTAELEHVMSVLGLAHEEMARLLGVSARSLFRWRQTGVMPDAGVAQLLESLRGICEDARERGDLDLVVEFIRSRAAEGRGAILRTLFKAVPSDSLRACA